MHRLQARFNGMWFQRWPVVVAVLFLLIVFILAVLHLVHFAFSVGELRLM